MNTDHLVTKVIWHMREAGYSESTLNAYRVLYKHLIRYMSELGINEYTPEVGKQALVVMKAHRNSEKNKRCCEVVIKHINNYLAGIPFETPKAKQKQEPIKTYQEFNEYLEWCIINGAALSTMKKRSYIVKCIADGFEALGLVDVKDLSLQLVIDYCNSMSECSLSKKNDFTVVLKAILRFLHSNNYVDTDYSTNVLKVPYFSDSRIPSYYTKSEVTSLLQAIGTKTPIQKRNNVLALIAARTGMRRMDIAMLKFSSIDWENDKIQVVQNKTGASLW